MNDIDLKFMKWYSTQIDCDEYTICNFSTIPFIIENLHLNIDFTPINAYLKKNEKTKGYITIDKMSDKDFINFILYIDRLNFKYKNNIHLLFEKFNNMRNNVFYTHIYGFARKHIKSTNTIYPCFICYTLIPGNTEFYFSNYTTFLQYMYLSNITKKFLNIKGE